MNVDKDNWKELDINVDSLWMIDSRAKGGKRSNSYHGNFVPQIPNEMIRRYTEKGDTVLDMFMGSGTTLFECESLERNFIGFDINDSLIEQVNGQMTDTTAIDFKIHNCDITDSEKVTKDIEEDLKELKKKSVDLIISHPPYMDIIQFTDKEEDLSHIQNLNDFIATFTKAVENCFKYLGRRKYSDLALGNGLSWGRRSSKLCKNYKIEVRKDLTPGNSVDAVRLVGFNTDFHFKQAIRSDIKEEIKKRKCVMLGVNGNKADLPKLQADR